MELSGPEQAIRQSQRDQIRGIWHPGTDLIIEAAIGVP